MSSWIDDAVDLARAWDEARPRTQQTEPGWSNMTGCRAETGYMVRGDWPTDVTDTWPAEIGTLLHAGWTEIRRAWYAEQGLHAAFDVPITYAGVRGHADEVLWPAEDGGRWSVTDFKFPGLASIRMWADDQFLNELFVQPNGYGAGLLEPFAREHAEQELAAAGQPMVPWSKYRLDADSCTVRLLGMPVGSGATFEDWQGHERPLSVGTADAAAARYEDVVAAVQAGEQLPRDKDYWWCERFCQFVSLCRGFDRHEPKDLEEITDPEAAAAIEAYGIATELVGANEKIRKELRPLLEGRRGKARGYKVFHARGNPGKMELDQAAVEEFLGSRGVPLDEMMRQGAPGQAKLTVTRIVKPS